VFLQEEGIETQMITEGDHERTQGEDVICKPRREALRETSPVHTLILDFILQN
jgi:hypothetical protein